MKEPLYPVEITPKILANLHEEEIYYTISRSGVKQLAIGLDIIKIGRTKNHPNPFDSIYLPLSSTPLKQLSYEEIDKIALTVWNKWGDEKFAITYSSFNDAIHEVLSLSVSPLVKEEKTENECCKWCQIVDCNKRAVLWVSDKKINGQFNGYCFGHFDRLSDSVKSKLIHPSPQSDHINPIELLEWISVKERFPEIDVDVLLWVTEDFNCYEIGRLKKNGEWDTNHDLTKYREIPYWKPLPAKPKI